MTRAEKDHLRRVWHRLKPWPDTVKGLKRLKQRMEKITGQLGLTFDAWCYQTQMDEMIDLADAFPATPFIVNPPVGTVYRAGDLINFDGYATDAEDGLLSRNAIAQGIPPRLRW